MGKTMSNIQLNTIYNEDCLETMKRMPDGFVDLTVTSPPYDNLRTYNGFEFDWHKTIEELYRVTKDGGVAVWVVGDATIKGSETGTSFKQALWAKECGFNLHDTMIYAKQNYIPLTHNRYEQAYEYMFIWTKGRPSTFMPLKTASRLAGKKISRKNTARTGEASTRNRDEITEIKPTKYRSNIWTYIIGKRADNGNHPATFPIELASDHIKTWSEEGDTIYDPFMGSGTTAKACQGLNRNYIGSEISKEYCDIANKRLSQEVLL